MRYDESETDNLAGGQATQAYQETVRLASMATSYNTARDDSIHTSTICPAGASDAPQGRLCLYIKASIGRAAAE